MNDTAATCGNAPFLCHRRVDGDGIRKDQQRISAQITLGVDDVELLTQLRQHTRRAFVRPFGNVARVSGWDLKQADVRERRRAGQPRFSVCNPLVHPADQLVSAGVQRPTRVHLVADGALGPMGDHLASLVLERGIRLKPTEVGPTLMKAGRHAQIFAVEMAREADGLGEIEISPAAGGESLDFDLPVYFTSSARLLSLRPLK